jgi:hypothetical protein
MANPNILSASTITGHNAYGNLTTSTVSLVSNAASSGKIFKVSSIIIANDDGTNSADVTINLNTSAAGAGTDHAIYYQVSVPGKSSIQLIDRNGFFYVAEDDSITGSASANSDLNYFISYEEISE